jgi:hypothetical protein
MNKENMESVKTEKTWLTIASEEIPQGSIPFPEDEERLDYEDEKEFFNKFSMTE